ncbi:hypothetical protein Acsp06_40510 [Actinomycetospora sp. NBRC 106375]|uniref:hypothetical protein n=1 Tax=Actinomycetospora sp. NBRC 106375 TaxID=3032207 RepID=UPI0024A1BBD6|nr:hypothetical protein [Actinomycetospora sp. NBRC 106375]GLZ47866.1 hypothetical protein Acsp06_40510 [Actinomycetospora sp. NBRC 106375]
MPDPRVARAAIEHCYDAGWTDGLPVVPCTEDALAELLATTARDPDEVLLDLPQIGRAATVRLAAVTAVMAGCRPEYFPVVLAAWDSLRAERYPGRGIWQSTTGTAPMVLVNGPVAERIGLNAAGNVFGSGVRANATIGRAIRLAAITIFGLRPGELDQATQGTPAKHTCCLAENAAASPWDPLHVDLGFDAASSTVTAIVIRSIVHVEARHTARPEQLLRDLAGTAARTGALLHASTSAALVLSPEHAHLLADAGWSKADVSRAVHEESWIDRDRLAAVGKSAVSSTTRWRVPDDHPEATGHVESGLHALTSPEAVLVVVAGAANAGVSAVVDTFGPRGGPPPTVAVEDGDLDRALAPLRHLVARDGYALTWSVRGGAVAVDIAAGPQACEDCLAPRPVIAGVLADALAGSGWRLGDLSLPTDPVMPPPE